MPRWKSTLLRLTALGVCLVGPALLSNCGGGDSGGSGTGGDCGECFRPIDCVKQCGGAVVQSGCCACPAGTFDSFMCKDAGDQ